MQPIQLMRPVIYYSWIICPQFGCIYSKILMSWIRTSQCIALEVGVMTAMLRGLPTDYLQMYGLIRHMSANLKPIKTRKRQLKKKSCFTHKKNKNSLVIVRKLYGSPCAVCVAQKQSRAHQVDILNNTVPRHGLVYHSVVVGLPPRTALTHTQLIV